MALRDHFHAPLSIRRHWHSFHNAWATAIAIDLNTHLPEGYFAEPNVQFGIEIDPSTGSGHRVATLQEPPDLLSNGSSNGNVMAPVLAGSAAGLTPPAPMQTLAFQTTSDTVEVMIFSTDGGPTLVGAIELVSPANKACPELAEWDRRTHRETFVSKCETYLRQGVGLVIVDIVTNRKRNLHNELLARLVGIKSHLSATLYAVSYRVVERSGQTNLDIWPESLTLGQPLPPTIPFWLRGGIYLPLALNNTYERICRELRIS